MSEQNLTPTNLKNLFLNLFQEENAVVIVVDSQDQSKVLEYRVEPLAEVVATLALNGFGTPSETAGVTLNFENQIANGSANC